MWQWTFDLGPRGLGTHEEWIGLEFPNREIGPSFLEDILAFELTDETPGGTLPYVTDVRLEPAGTPEDPIHPGDSVHVSVRGLFPTCGYTVKGMTKSPSIVSPSPGPPAIRLTIERGECREPCTGSLPFEASMVLPPLEVGAFDQWIEMVENDCASGEVGWSFVSLPFEVTATPPCLQTWFFFEVLRCGAVVGPGNPGTAILAVASPLPLSELHGSIRIEPRGIEVVDIRPCGRAKSARLEWAPTGSGARFSLAAGLEDPLEKCFSYSVVGYWSSYDCGVLEITLGIPAHQSAVPSVLILDQIAGTRTDGYPISTCRDRPPADSRLRICPEQVQLSDPRPNPFAGRAVFQLTLNHGDDVTVAIYDLAGRRVATPHSGPLVAGVHTIEWNGVGTDGVPMPSGMYFARAFAGGTAAVRRAVLVRDR